MNQSRRDFWVLIAAACLVVALVPLLVRGDAETNARRKTAVAAIAQLSPAERQAFDQNARRFASLSPEERQRWVEMHNSLKANPSANSALEVFSSWWPSISPQQQAEIHRQHDPAARVQLVDQAQKDLDSQRDDRATQLDRFWGRLPRDRRDMVIEPSEFYRIMDAVQLAASESDLTKAEQDEIDAQPVHSLQRVLTMLKILNTKGRDFQAIFDTPHHEQILVDSISNPRLKELITNNRRTGTNRLAYVRVILWRSLLREIMKDNLKQPIVQQDLLAELDKQPDTEKERLYSFSAIELQWKLRQMILLERASFNSVGQFFQRPGENLETIIRERFRGRGDQGPPGGPPGPPPGPPPAQPQDTSNPSANNN